MNGENGPLRELRAAALRLVWGGGFLLLGLLLCAGAATAWATPRLLEREPSNTSLLAGLFVLGVILSVCGGLCLRGAAAYLKNTETMVEPERSCHLYGRHLVGIGFALLVDALVNVVVMAVLAVCYRAVIFGAAAAQAAQGAIKGDEFDAATIDRFTGSTGSPAAADALGRLFGHDRAESILVIALLVLSTLVALLGALFFFANALWAKMGDPQREPFDRSAFWSGLWFRIGEAVLFNLVFFLLFRLYAPEQYLLLPLVSLLIGMFLKSGEQLVSGLATRLFAAVSELLPIEKGVPKSLKLYEKRLDSLAADAAQAEKDVRAIEEALKTLEGVEDVRADLREPRTLRVLLDPARTSAEKINLRLRMHGV